MELVGFNVLCSILVLLCSVLTVHAEDVCYNGGKVSTGNYPKCSCRPGYKGSDCSQKVTPCEGKPCRNSGECLENVNGSFTCKCQVNYDGLICEKRVRPCDSQPCKNGGNCSDDGMKCFQCYCADGFKGTACSEKILPCEVSPCGHGGLCYNEEDGGFKCTCRNGYGGLLCYQEDAFYSSYILDGKLEYLDLLHEWLDDETADWRLCYRASRDGWKSGDFHSRCDHKGPTVTLIQVGYNIFGGYSDIAWGGSTGYKQTTKSFLFSFRNNDNLKPFKSPVYKNSGNAIYQNPGYGPTFGGHDVYIKDNAYFTTGSYSNFGHTYKPPKDYVYGSTKAKNLLAGSYNFIPTEIEVFYLR